MTERSPYMHEGSRGVLGQTLRGIGNIAELGVGITRMIIHEVPELFNADTGLLRRHAHTEPAPGVSFTQESSFN